MSGGTDIMSILVEMLVCLHIMSIRLIMSVCSRYVWTFNRYV